MRKTILIIFLLALLNSFFWNSKIFGHSLIGGDELDYDKVATNILESRNFCIDVEGECIEPQPLYPIFLAAIFSVFGHNLDAVRLIQIILFALTAILVFLLAKKLFSQKVAIYSGLLMALFYPLASYTNRLCKEVFFAFLVVLLIYCLSHAYLNQKKKWFIFSGITLGLLMLTNAITYFLPLLIIANFLIIYKKRFFNKKMLISFLLFLFSLVIIVSPWLIRNYYSDIKSVNITGGSTLLSRAYLIDDLQGEYKEHFIGQAFGHFFAKKLNPQLDSRKLFAFPPKAVRQRIKELSSFGYNQGEMSAIFQKEALLKIFRNPHLYCLNGLLYFLSFNNPMLPDLKTFTIFRIQNLFVGTHPELTDFTKASIILTIRLIWLMFFFFVIYGGIKMVRSWSKFGWLILIILYFNLVYSLLFAIPRYALPIWPFYIILFIYGLSFFWPKFKLKKSDTY